MILDESKHFYPRKYFVLLNIIDGEASISFVSQ